MRRNLMSAKGLTFTHIGGGVRLTTPISKRVNKSLRMPAIELYISNYTGFATDDSSKSTYNTELSMFVQYYGNKLIHFNSAHEAFAAYSRLDGMIKCAVGAVIPDGTLTNSNNIIASLSAQQCLQNNLIVKSYSYVDSMIHNRIEFSLIINGTTYKKTSVTDIYDNASYQTKYFYISQFTILASEELCTKIVIEGKEYLPVLASNGKQGFLNTQLDEFWIME